MVQIEEGSREGRPAPQPAGEEGRSFLRNSFANAISGFSGALLTLAVPPVLSRMLKAETFSAWTLVLQLAAYANYLNLGIQGGVSRYVAFYKARGEPDEASRIVSTAFALLAAIALATMAGLLVLALNLGGAFPQIPPTVLKQATWALGITAVVLALGLPFGALWGALLGYQRNDLVALSQAGSRFLAATGLIVTPALGGDLISMAVAFALAQVVGYAVTSATYARYSYTRLARSLVTRRSLQDLWSYSQTMLVWLLCLFLITGVDTALVGKFDFRAVGLYGACAGATLTIAGVQQAIFGPLLQIAASHSGAGSPHVLPDLLTRATRISSLLMLCLVTPVLVFAGPILAFWLGPTQAADGETVLRIMLTGHFLRLLWTPYSLLLLGTLRHREIMLMPAVEAVLNVVVAIVAGSRYGAVGVSMGVLAGALASQFVTIFVNMQRTSDLTPRRGNLLRQAVLRPAACFAPAIVAAIAVSCFPVATGWEFGIAALAASLLLAWRWGLSQEDRARALGLAGMLVARACRSRRRQSPREKGTG